jgi:hypothetical protein
VRALSNEHTRQELVCALNIRVRNCGACTEHTRQELMALSARTKFEKVSSKHAEHKRLQLMRTLSKRTSFLCVCSA